LTETYASQLFPSSSTCLVDHTGDASRLFRNLPLLYALVYTMGVTEFRGK
jgi:hypothetical protein